MPKGQFFINGKDAYDTWGVSLDDGSIAALLKPPGMKTIVTNESRLENGKRIDNSIPKVKDRDITLVLHLVAKDSKEFITRLKSFTTELTTTGELVLSTSYSTDAYHCTYIDCTQFSEFYMGIANFTLKLNEYNPTQRG